MRNSKPAQCDRGAGFWGEVFRTLRVKVGEDACGGVGGLVGDVFVVDLSPLGRVG